MQEITFIATAFKHRQNVNAIYIPRAIIDFYKIPVEPGSWWSSVEIKYRQRLGARWMTASGYLGLYSTRNTIRVLFQSHDKEDIRGATQFKIPLDIVLHSRQH